jgi:hypothetical protein
VALLSYFGSDKERIKNNDKIGAIILKLLVWRNR